MLTDRPIDIGPLKALLSSQAKALRDSIQRIERRCPVESSALLADFTELARQKRASGTAD